MTGMAITDGTELLDVQRYATHGYPHELWTRMRREAPVHWCEPAELVPFWAITKHAHICEISKQPDVFVSGNGIVPATKEVAERLARGERGPVRHDADDHHHGPAQAPRVPQGGEPVLHAARDGADRRGGAGERAAARGPALRQAGERRGHLRLRDRGRGAAPAAHPVLDPRRLRGGRADRAAARPRSSSRARTPSSSAARPTATRRSRRSGSSSCSSSGRSSPTGAPTRRRTTSRASSPTPRSTARAWATSRRSATT